ncbi:SMP-30/gluconolactonase/LRE family protein [Gelidibacter gilvus]|uniref:SMP-30/Gluconolactonase/LRE-like region domain-containing protein n=1 Tax=Gelidibacter gilvus TaxID=59602 RepID=A0A4Q0XDG7_9FLAO|nr:hypothetical protein [Gelidibacter gilvus]RXJ45787.1 hypothetical protein ESZ48_14485 [Gelidibacter gilvus]
MKPIIYAVLGLLITTSCKNNKAAEIAQADTVQIPTATFITETLGLTHCESAVYNAKQNIIYASLIGEKEPGDGAIATIDLDGKLIDALFISGLNDPKGIAITEYKLYVSDINELVEADLKTGKIIKKYSHEGLEFLNDVAIDGQGNVYVSDTGTSKIYQLDTQGNFSLWLADENLDRPNGLLVQNNTMYVASWGSQPNGGRVSKIDMTTKAIDSITTIIGNLDGIRPYDKDRLIISDWNSGMIHLVDYDGNTQEVLQVGQSVGDIAYIQEKKLLLLPMNKQSRLLFYRLD